MRLAQRQIRTLLADRAHGFGRAVERQGRREIATHHTGRASDGEARHQETEAGGEAKIEKPKDALSLRLNIRVPLGSSLVEILCASASLR